MSAMAAQNERFLSGVETVRLFFITSIYPPQTGGGASRIYDFVTILASKGHSTFVFTYQPLREMRKARFFAREHGVWVLRATSPLPRNPIDQIPALFVAAAFFGIFWRPRAVVLSVPAGEPSIGGYLASRVIGARRVFDVRDEWEDAIIRKGRRIKRLQYRFYKALFTRLYHKANLVLTVTPSIQRRLQERGTKPILLPNGADTTLFKPQDRTPAFLQSHLYIRKDDFLIIYAGQVGWYYRLDVVIQSLARIKRTLSDKPVKLIVMGKGERLSEYKRLAEELGLGGSVIFTGEVQRREVAEVMNRCNLGVIPYDDNPLWSSAYGTKIFEHCASGLPTVVSILPGSDLEKLVLEKGIGYVVKPLGIEDFASKIEFLLRNPAVLEDMRRSALSLAGSFNRQRLAEQLVGLL